MNIYGIYGFGGFGREVMPLLRQQISDKDKLYFVDDAISTDSINGCEVTDFESFATMTAEKKFMTITVASAKIRQKLTQRAIENNITMLTITAPNTVILDDVEMGAGSVICPFVTLTSNITIGDSFHANIYSYVAHDCKIGNYVTFAPCVKCNGNIVIEDNVYIGTGAIIKQGTPGKPIIIGKGAKVAAGSYVTKSIPEGTTVFGSPAVKLTRDNIRKMRG